MYSVNAERLGEEWRDCTPIYVRAQLPDGTWVAANLAQLTKESLLAWLRSDGTQNPLAENVVGILCGYDHIVEMERTTGEAPPE